MADDKLTIVFRKRGGGRRDAAYLVTVERSVPASGSPFFTVEKRWGKWSTYLQEGHLQPQNAYTGTNPIAARRAVATVIQTRHVRGYEREAWYDDYPEWAAGWPGVPHSAIQNVVENPPLFDAEHGKLVTPAKTKKPEGQRPASGNRRRRRGHRGKIEVD